MWSAAAVLVCALELLGRSANTFPPIVLLDAPPRDASVNAQAFVRAGSATIHVITSTAAFRAARAASHRCGEREALRKIASIIVHEEWHVRHGADERGAYTAQLVALMIMGAGEGTPLYAEVSRSMRAVTRPRPAAAVALSRLPPNATPPAGRR